MSQHFLNLIRKGETAEIAAVVEETPELARCRDPQGVSALMWSVYTGQPVVRDFLRQHAGDLDISEAACLGDCECLQKLIASDAMLARAVSGDGWPPLHLSAAFAGPEAVTLLIEHGAHIHQISHNPLRNQALHACIALGNSKPVVGTPAHGRIITLLQQLAASSDSPIAESALWALSRIQQAAQAPGWISPVQ